MVERQDLGLISTHWALGGLVLVGLASSEFAGAATIVALPLVALTTALGALCEPAVRPISNTLRKKRCGDFVEFLEIWLNFLELLAAAATCARVASATMDYMSKGRLRDWLFGLESHSLGEPWPDVLGVTIMVVTTGLFMLGLDRSTSLSILLHSGLVASFIFFTTIGGFHTDIIFWNWTEDFDIKNWESILPTAAMCSYAFPNTIPRAHKKNWCIKYVCFSVLPLFCYITIVLIFTLMSHFRELSGTAIPLVRVFEVRDVDWARPIMATCTIFVACIALTEIMPSLHNCVIKLSNREWNVLVSSLTYRNPMTGAPVLAIFTVGSLASILAFACPLSYLVRLLNVGPLLKCALRSSRTLHARYKPECVHEDLTVQHSNIKYSRLSKGQKRPTKPSSTSRIKTAFDVIPRFLRNTQCNNGTKPSKSFLSTTKEDKECLLMDDYNATQSSKHISVESESDSDGNEAPSICTDGEADSSTSSATTDIDAVVQEYKDQIQVKTARNFSDQKTPTWITSRIVLVLVCLIHAASVLITIGVKTHVYYLMWSSFITILVCAVVILVMPQNKRDLPKDDLLSRKVFPYIAIPSTVLNGVLATVLMFEVWFGLVMWIFGGLVLFCRCDCCNCEGLYTNSNEHLRLNQAAIKECTSTNQHSDHIDAVLITR